MSRRPAILSPHVLLAKLIGHSWKMAERFYAELPGDQFAACLAVAHYSAPGAVDLDVALLNEGNQSPIVDPGAAGQWLQSVGYGFGRRGLWAVAACFLFEGQLTAIVPGEPAPAPKEGFCIHGMDIEKGMATIYATIRRDANGLCLGIGPPAQSMTRRAPLVVNFWRGYIAGVRAAGGGSPPGAAPAWWAQDDPGLN